MPQPVRPLARISMSLPEELRVCLDRVVARRGFPSRSHAIAVMLNRYLCEHKTLLGEEPLVGTITLLYGNEPQLLRQLARAQQKFRAQIVSCATVPLAAEQTLAVVFVQGPANRLKVIGEELVALRGVSYSNTQLVYSNGGWDSVAASAAVPRPELQRRPACEPSSDVARSAQL